MTRRQLLRRVGILCCLFLQNFAYYTASWKKGKPVFEGEYWTAVANNFIDICVLEWCKLFADKNGKQSWRRVITDQGRFYYGLLKAVRLTEDEFDAYITEMREYRDKFVAHLDEEPIMNIPTMRIARKSISYLYDYLRTNEEIENCFHDAPTRASSHYEYCSNRARQVYCG